MNYNNKNNNDHSGINTNTNDNNNKKTKRSEYKLFKVMTSYQCQVSWGSLDSES